MTQPTTFRAAATIGAVVRARLLDLDEALATIDAALATDKGTNLKHLAARGKILTERDILRALAVEGLTPKPIPGTDA